MKSIWIAVLAGCCAFIRAVSPDVAEAKVKVLHAFGNGTDGQSPAASLIDVNGILYGTTLAGGTNSNCYDSDCGTVFALDPTTGAETILHSFGSSQDGQAPTAAPINVNGTLYGTTAGGGNGSGTLYALDPNTGTETVLYTFCSQVDCADGQYPYANLVNVKGTLYGTTGDGGGYGAGTVFAFDPAKGVQTVTYSFCSERNCADGWGPLAGLINVNGTLYGTTEFGGSYDDGAVFAVDRKTGAETVLYSFCSAQNCADGAGPRASLIDVNGTLYGTTLVGGTNDRGTVFAIDLTTGAETVVYSFCAQHNCTDGAGPLAGLISVKGTLYGTTQYGGTYNDGTVFALDPNTGAATVLHSFRNGADGQYPAAGLIAVGHKLYGTTQAGGTYGYGTLFALRRP